MKKSNNIWAAILGAIVVLAFMIGFFFLGYFSSAKGWIDIKEPAPAEEELPEGEENEDEETGGEISGTKAAVASYTVSMKGEVMPLAAINPGGDIATPVRLCDQCGTGNVTTVRIEATCYREGSITATCDNCSYRYSEIIPKLEHDLGPAMEVEATALYCTDTAKKCSSCGFTFYSNGTTSRTAHTEVLESTQAATCSEPGLRVYKCTKCQTTSQEDIPTIPHTRDSGTITKYATCTTDGTREYRCSVCNAYMSEETIPAKGHTYPEVGVQTTAPTCTEEGTMTFVCTVCGGGERTAPIEAIGHDFQLVESTEPTCTEPGHGEYLQCANCEEIAGEIVEIPALGHTWTEWEETRESCDVAGERTRTCTVCGEEETEELDAGTHSWDDGVVTTPATCTESGVLTKTCLLCGETTEETIAATGHNHVKRAAVSPTCTKTGLTEGEYCSKCDAVFTAQQIVPALGHDMTHYPAVEATEEAGGNVEYWQCARCGGYFADADGKTELAAEDTLIPPLGADEDPGDAEDPAEEGGLEWWHWAIIVGGVVIVIGLVLVIVDQVNAKKKAGKAPAKNGGSKNNKKR